MTPKIARFLADHVPATPCLVLDVDRIEANFRALRAALPTARVYYAVKANPALPVLSRLVALESCFDAASLAEVEACLEAGAKPTAISFGNTIKKSDAISRAYALGVSLFAFDSHEELMKLAKHAPGSRVYCRLAVENKGADWPLSRKFGTTVAKARSLMVEAARLGLDPYGLSFHVGSQQTSPDAFVAAVARAAMLFTDLRDSGLNLRMLNLGGGFPVPYRDPVPGIEIFANAITAALTDAFGNNIPAIIIEPGRFISATAGVIETEVVLVTERDPADARRWVYLDIGRFGGLAETENEAIRYDIVAPPSSGANGPVVIAGPSCDGVDVLYEKTRYELPLSLVEGDRLRLLSTGAYVTTYASQGFNGFDPLDEHYI